ncbi:hypothetical protein QFZ79_002917 [Arthrobacter sp. V4I6]|uniref:hypothetical protein n=1 Tax=Arthrobacter sp. V4I6 TaxID=3042281 RepID=UPI00278B69E4|nr:hypothetical protein [Arthrobacter sp. V4I6]MDQ0854806.1 hypothetical protein [Arthrobacter sp. V4I6]
MTAAMLDDPEGRALVAAIHTRKLLAEELAAADAAYTSAVQAAVGGYGDWGHVRQAAEVAHQCRAAVKAHETTGQTAHQEGTR